MAKTFVETFLAVFTVDNFINVTDKETLQTVVLSTSVSALAAALTAVLNMLISFIKSAENQLNDSV